MPTQTRLMFSQRDKVGFWFDGPTPAAWESERGFSHRYRTHAGGGIDGIETRSCSSLSR